MKMNHQLGWKTCFALATSSIALMAPVCAQAQSAPVAEGASAPDSGNGDIVVTARRKSESLSKVPLSVSALSADSLARQGVHNESDLQSAVPGFAARETGNAAVLTLSVRGQTIDGFSSSPPAVLPYINEFQVATAGATSFFDLESVQVLKGPQGTLFGRNTTGGAVLYTTTKPGNEFEGFMTARYGNREEVGIQAGVTLPIVKDMVSLRVAGNYSDGGGFVKNLGYYPVTSPFVPSAAPFVSRNDTLGSIKDRTIRGTLMVKPVDGIENTTLVQYSADDGTLTPSMLYSVAAPDVSNIPSFYANAFNGITVADGPFAGTSGALGANVAWQRKTNTTTYTNSRSELRTRSLLATNTTKIKLGSDLTLKNTIGWQRVDRNYSASYGGSAFDLYRGGNFFDDPNFPTERGSQHNIDRTFSDELQLQGDLFDNKLNFIAGLYYANAGRVEDNHNVFFGAALAPYRFNTRDRSYAIFGQATYKLTDVLHLTAGVRYSKDKIDGHQKPGGTFTNVIDPIVGGVFPQDQDITFKNPSWTFSLDYQVTPDLMVYVTQRGSWRAGGFNFPATPRNYDGSGLVTPSNPLGLTGNLFNAEKSRDVELGAKFNGRIGDTKVSATVDVFNQWVSDVQRTAFIFVGQPGLVTINVPNAQITGEEVSLSVNASDWLTLGGQLTHINARYTDGAVLAAGLPHNAIQYGNVSEWSGSAFFEVNYPLQDSSSITLRGDVYAQSKFNFADYKPAGAGDTEIAGYALVNGRLSWNKISGSNLTVSVYGKNIFNKMYYSGGLATETSFGSNTAAPGRPRTFGAEVTLKF